MISRKIKQRAHNIGFSFDSKQWGGLGMLGGQKAIV